MTPSLSGDLDTAALAQAFAARRRLHIPGLLAAESADALADALELETRWKTTVAAGDAWFELPLNGRDAADPAKQSWLDEAAVDGANPRMQFIYDTLRPPVAEDDPVGSDLAEGVRAFLNGEPFLSFARGDRR